MTARNGNREGSGAASGPATAVTRDGAAAPGKRTLTERLAPVQRRTTSSAPADGNQREQSALAEAIQDPFGLHLGAVVQRKEAPIDRGATREASSIDAPRADSIEEDRSTLAIPGAQVRLSGARLERARHANRRYWAHLRFNADAFC